MPMLIEDKADIRAKNKDHVTVIEVLIHPFMNIGPNNTNFYACK